METIASGNRRTTFWAQGQGRQEPILAKSAAWLFYGIPHRRGMLKNVERRGEKCKVFPETLLVKLTGGDRKGSALWQTL